MSHVQHLDGCIAGLIKPFWMGQCKGHLAQCGLHVLNLHGRALRTGRTQRLTAILPLETREYRMQQKAAWTAREHVVLVDPSARRITSTYKGEATSLPWRAGVLERHGATAALIHTDLGTGDHAANVAMGKWLGPALDALAGSGGYILANQSLDVARWQRLPEPPGVPKDRYFLYRVS